MGVTGARKDFPPPYTKPPGWVDPPNTQPDDPIRQIPHNPKKNRPVFPGAPIEPPPYSTMPVPERWPVVGNPPESPIYYFAQTEDAAKIVPSAPTNNANNNMVAGRSTNTIHGEENNALQGGKPENASNSTPLSAMGTSNAALGSKAPKKAGCTTPYFVYNKGAIGMMASVSYNTRCDCFVSTGIDVLEIVSGLFTGGAAAGAIRFFKGAKKLNNLKDATKALSKHLKKLSQLKKDLRAGGPYGESIKRFCQRAMREELSFELDIDLIGADEINQYKSQIMGYINSDKGLYDAMYKEAKEAGLGGKGGFQKLLARQDWQELLGGLSVLGGIGGAAAWAVGALDYLDFEIYRPKECEARNRGTLEACQCVCDDDTYTECYDYAALGVIDTIVSPILSFFPLLTLGAYASQDEYVGCDAPCTCLSYREQDAFGNALCQCVCDPPDLPYGNGPCHYARNFDSDTCCCDCPEGSHLAEGLSPSGQNYARLDDNLGTVAPSAFHESYSTGCNYRCDGRESDSSDMISPWPPVCPADYIFDSSALVCKCIPCPVRQYTCTDSGSVDDCANCPPGYTCDPGDPENGISAGCSIVTEVGSAVESSEDCEALLGVAAHSGQWGAGWYCV